MGKPPASGLGLVEELDEDILFADDDGVQSRGEDTGCGHSSEEDHDEEQLEDAATYAEDVEGLDGRAGEVAEQNSAKSSTTLHATMEESDTHEDEVTHARMRPIPASMPVTSHIRMGTSMPIAVPNMAQWKKAMNPGAADSPTAYPATFVPPHQLSHVNNEGFMFSLHGESPSTAIRRERLKTRNAILKSTGFLEPGVNPTINNIGLQERNRLALAQGGIAQALQGASAAAL